MLANQLAKRDQRVALQAQRHRISIQARSFDSVCDEAEQLLTVSDLGKSQDCYRVCSHI